MRRRRCDIFARSPPPIDDCRYAAAADAVTPMLPTLPIIVLRHARFDAAFIACCCCRCCCHYFRRYDIAAHAASEALMFTMRCYGAAAGEYLSVMPGIFSLFVYFRYAR